MVSIIIVNYHSLQLVEDCIRSVFERTRQEEFEIIVVDNASQPGCSHRLEQIFPGHVRTIELPENIGLDAPTTLVSTPPAGSTFSV